MNKDKTTGIFIIKSKERTPNFKDIKWTKNYDKTLGICHGYNIDTNEIWLKKINKIKNCLQVWKARGLTFKGKILVLKTYMYVVSIINFEIETRGIPTKCIEEIDKIMSDFLWDNKRALVSKAQFSLA
jgi:hypothetical protein